MDKNYYKEYFILERTHWWFLGRLKILESQVSKKINPDNKQLNILNIGVATGATSLMLQKFGTVTSIEYDLYCCQFLHENTTIKPINASMTDLPFANETFDLVCAFDVIEHIEDDLLALKEMKRVLQNDGTFFITVPAFMFLWSKHDEINHHFRRYTWQEMKQKLKTTGMADEYNSFFNFFLFFQIAIVRLTLKMFPKKNNSGSTGSDFEGLNSNKVVNAILLQVLKLENFLLKLGLRFPFGVSLIVWGKKNI